MTQFGKLYYEVMLGKEEAETVTDRRPTATQNPRIPTTRQRGERFIVKNILHILTQTDNEQKATKAKAKCKTYSIQN